MKQYTLEIHAYNLRQICVSQTQLSHNYLYYVSYKKSYIVKREFAIMKFSRVAVVFDWIVTAANQTQQLP